MIFSILDWTLSDQKLKSKLEEIFFFSTPNRPFILKWLFQLDVGELNQTVLNFKNLHLNYNWEYSKIPQHCRYSFITVSLSTVQVERSFF